MKRLFLIIAVEALLMGCTKDNGPQAVNGVIKIADYLYEYEAENYSPEPPSIIPTDSGYLPLFSCSSVRNGNYFGRNLDFTINGMCEFVVRTKATNSRKHASIGIANSCFKTITDDDVKAGLSDELLEFLPWMTMDGINDAGLVCNINVVNTADIEKYDNTNEGKPKIMTMNLVRALLDNCSSVEDAKTFILNHDILPSPGTWDCHIMIADPQRTVVVEFTGEEEKVKFTETEIMTNFYNYQYANNVNNGVPQEKAYPRHACGIERYEILKANYALATSKVTMWELLKKVHYTQAYDTSANPFWCSEYYDTAKIPTFDSKPVEYWTKERILEQAEPQKAIAAYENYKRTGTYNPEDGIWFTTHNSTYDIANKTLRVTARENYGKYYDFNLQ